MTPALPPILRAARGFSGSRRLLLLGVIAAVVVAIGLLGRWASAPAYVSLYHDLDLSESGSMADQLSKAGIPFRLESGGSELRVPTGDLARARVALAKVGLPSTGRPGLELFDKASWGMTDFTQRVTYQRALEGELARTVAGIRGVQRAQVHLVLPASSPLRRLERPASASVVLTLKPGVVLTSDTVQGITYIVSNSVEQLSSENVAVMDDTGHVLSMPSGASSTGLTTRQLEVQRSLERGLTEKIEDLLATVVGTGRARAQVSAQMSFDQIERTVESFDPDGQVLETEQRSEGGVGTAADGTGGQTVVSNSYQNSRKAEKSVSALGKVTRLTVAVLVDDAALQGGKDRPAVRLADLEAMVRDAAGVDSTRGDRLSVLSVPFQAVALPPGGSAAAAGEKIRSDPMQAAERFSRPAVGLVAIVALLLVALSTLRVLGSVGSRSGTASAVPSASGAEGTVRELPAHGNVRMLRERLQSESSERPETAAQVVRTWLAES